MEPSEQSDAVATTAEVVADQPEAVATPAEEMDGSEVLATAEEIPDGCGCPVCLSFLVEPLTLRCGHSFCRLCLIQSTTLSPDGRSCPLCRSEVDIHDPATHAASEALESAVRAAVDGDDYEARRAAHAAALAELRAKQATELPIFFMHPGTRRRHRRAPPLEPRYKILIRRAWEGGKEFVYCGCVPRVGAPGVVVRVDDAHFFPDGRCCIRGVGGASSSAPHGSRTAPAASSLRACATRPRRSGPHRQRRRPRRRRGACPSPAAKGVR